MDGLARILPRILNNMTSSTRKEMLQTVIWKDDSVLMIDQTRLPTRLVYVKCREYEDIVKAIKNMVVRGAPAIGISAAFGLALAAKNSKARTPARLMNDLNIAYNVLRSTRPTAVNLFWGLDRVMSKAKTGQNLLEIKNNALSEAKKIADEDVQNNMTMGHNGADLLYDGDTVMTHCNAGALATSAYGTALGVIRAAKDAGKMIKVIATETRPVMQGSRLTTYELRHDNIDVTLIPDTAVGHIMSQGRIKCVIVGADRVLKSGHVFNKIGTYQIALMAKYHKVPFYVAAPMSTFDLKSDLDDVPIEQRLEDEVLKIGNRRIAAKGVHAFNPAFDVTPPELISGIITERGVLRPPFDFQLKSQFRDNEKLVHPNS
jgi:methylthioribose-1-phosphate isomerase